MRTATAAASGTGGACTTICDKTLTVTKGWSNDCGSDKKSETSLVLIYLKVKNDKTDPLRVDWLDYNGDPITYRTL